MESLPLYHVWLNLCPTLTLHVLDPCLRGFTQTIPPVEEWDNYEVLDVNGGSFLYPELMFTCNGTLNSITIPYSTIEGIPWDDILQLDLVVWRRQREGGYSQVGGDITVPDVKISSEEFVTTNVKGFVTLQRALDIKTNDILQFKVPQYGSSDRREHIPYLLTDYQPAGCTEPITVPLIHVDFSGQPEEGKYDQFYISVIVEVTCYYKCYIEITDHLISDSLSGGHRSLPSLIDNVWIILAGAMSLPSTKSAFIPSTTSRFLPSTTSRFG